MWLAVLSSRVFVAFHVVALLFVCYHSYTWFKVMPKTMPPLPIPPQTVLRVSVGGVIGLSVIVLALVQWLGR
jgi:fumarate reductase subunit C